MKVHRLSRQEFEGFGVYAPARAHVRPIVAGIRGFGADLPSLTDLINNFGDYITVEGGVQVAKPEVRDLATQGLDKLVFTQTQKATGYIEGTAEYSPFNLFGEAWASKLLQSGYAILVDKTTVATSKGSIMATTFPQLVADQAAPGQKWVVVNAPASLLADAQKIATKQAPGGPGGTVTTLPSSGQPTPPTPPPPPVVPPSEQPGAKPSSSGMQATAIVALAALGLFVVYRVAESGRKSTRSYA